MKNLLKSIQGTTPTVVSSSDGVISTATQHLKAIKYPNIINDVAVIGKLKNWHRSFLLRPKYGGKFLFLIYPKNNISQATIISKEFYLQSFNSAPFLLNITIPTSLRQFYHWEWRVVKTENANEIEEQYEKQDILEISDGMLSGQGAMTLSKYAKEQQFFSTLIYQVRPLIEGEIIFEEEKREDNAKIVAWSCHQPYASESDQAIIKQESEKILSWYQNKVEEFSPHMIWMLGDSVYSDGTSSLDFVKQVYNQKGWENSSIQRKDLLSLYRLNYRYHWGFKSMQTIMRKFPHLGMWDDHEIRDGYGSEESDFSSANKVIKQIASQAAEEYLFQYSPKLRSESTKNSLIDNHQAYVNNTIASFIFDGRNSRNYGEDIAVPSEIILLATTLASIALDIATGKVASKVAGKIAGQTIGPKTAADIIDLYRWHNPGEVVSDLQLKDFERFCNHIKSQPHVRYLLLGNAVPFIYLLDFVESIAAESAIAGTDTGKNIRDDIRDSWHSPANRRQLSRLIDILRDLHQARDDIEFINISGDIHISNAFTFQPDGFNKPLYQVTSSALTNNPPGGSEEGILNLLNIDGPLSFNAKSKDFGKMERLWSETKKQNFLTIEADNNAIKLHLCVYNAEDVSSQEKDKILTIRPNQGFTLT